MAADDDTKGKKGKGDKDGKEKKSKGNLIPAIVIALGLVLGGKMMGGGAAAAPETAAAAAAEVPEEVDCAAMDAKTPPEEGAVFKMDSVSINLAAGHYLKVGVALQLSTKENAELFGTEGLAAKAADQVIGVLGGRSMEEFTSHEAIDRAKEELTERVRPLYECQVLDVLFTEFVMQ